METGILARWGASKTGREREGLELYRESVAYYRRLVGEGKLSYFEPFFLSSGDSEVESGFFILRGPVVEVFAMLDSQEQRDLTMRASLLLEHFRIDTLIVGEGIDRGMADYEKALRSVGV